MLPKYQAKFFKLVPFAILLVFTLSYLSELKPLIIDQLEQNKIKEYTNSGGYSYSNPFDNYQDSSLSMIKIAALNIRPDQTMLIYSVQKNKLHTTVINAGQILNFKISIPDSFIKLVNLAVKEIKTQGALVKTNDAIFDYLIKPIEKELKENVVVIPDPIFASLPIELIKNNNQFLIEKYTICYSNSIALWLKSGINHNKITGQPNILLFAPEFNSSLNSNNQLALSHYRDNKLTQLPFSKDEVNNIQHMYSQNGLQNTNYLGNSATENKARGYANSYSIIHIATHGQSSKSDISKNGVYFNKPKKESNTSDDGFLSLSEIPKMCLNAEMIVLSACNTSCLVKSKKQEIVSLPQSLIQQGAHNVVASVWKVHDEHTKDLMLAFYKHLLNDKCTYAKALQLAKIDCINQGFLPLDWGAFIIFGNSN